MGELMERREKMRNNAREDFNKLNFTDRIGLKDEKVSRELRFFGTWFLVFLGIFIWYGAAGVFGFDCDKFAEEKKSNCTITEDTSCPDCGKLDWKINSFFWFVEEKLFGKDNVNNKGNVPSSIVSILALVSFVFLLSSCVLSIVR